MWLINNEGANFLSPSVSTFPMLPGDDHDGFALCDECGELWGVHGTGDHDEHLRSKGWVVDGDHHVCPDH